MSELYQRYIIQKIEIAMLDTPVILLMGPRQTGKTTLAKSMLGEAWQYISLDSSTQYDAAKNDPDGFIRNLSAPHIVIDEIQRVPELLLAIKQSVDENRLPGRFLLTGSADALLMPKVLDSLAGRTESIYLNPLSECEIRAIQPSFFAHLLDGKAPQTQETRIRETLIDRLTKGCFPEPMRRANESRIRLWYTQYLNSLIYKDLVDIESIAYPEKSLQLLKSSAHFSGKLVNLTELGKGLALDSETIKNYLYLLEHLFLLRQIPAWHTNQYKRLVKAPKMHLCDTGLLCALTNIDQKMLREEPSLLGPLLETFVMNELIKQASWLDEDLKFYHYRDKDKVEVDCIIETMRGECIAIEIKSTATVRSTDFNGLRRFQSIAGERFKIGILLHDGDHTTAFGEGLFAVPLAALWAVS